MKAAMMAAALALATYATAADFEPSEFRSALEESSGTPSPMARHRAAALARQIQGLAARTAPNVQQDQGLGNVQVTGSVFAPVVVNVNVNGAAPGGAGALPWRRP